MAGKSPEETKWQQHSEMERIHKRLPLPWARTKTEHHAGVAEEEGGSLHSFHGEHTCAPHDCRET